MAQQSAASARNTSPEISAPPELWRYPEQSANVPQRSSLIPQRHYWIDPHRSPRRNIARKQRNKHQQERKPHESQWIKPTGAIKHIDTARKDQKRSHETGYAQRAHHPEQASENDWADSL